MKILLIIILTCPLFVNFQLSAEIYKWVDKDGNVSYSDKKPEGKKSEVVDMNNLTSLGEFKTDKSINKSQYQESQKRKSKVTKFKPLFGNTSTSKYSSLRKPSTKLTMYSANWCGYCKKARNYFITNGIKFAEHDIEKSANAKRKYDQLGGSGLPLIVSGDNQMQGFSVTGFKNFYSKIQK